MPTNKTLQKAIQLTFFLTLCITQLTCLDSNEPLPPRLAMRTFAGVDSFRGLPDTNFEDNSGVNLGAEGAYPLSRHQLLDELYLQMGASYGAYHFGGKGYYYKHPKRIENQAFFTLGSFKGCSKNSPWNIGLAYDVMLANNFGSYNESLWLSQWRVRTSLFISPFDEIGANITFRGRRFNKIHRFIGGHYKTSFANISQATAFWTHYYRENVYSTVWAGVPLTHRLDQRLSRRPGRFIIGGEISVPFCNAFELVGRAQYIQPANCKHWANEQGTNIAFAVYYNFGTSGAEQSISKPYLPLANNSNFLVDAMEYTKLKNY